MPLLTTIGQLNAKYINNWYSKIILSENILQRDTNSKLMNVCRRRNLLTTQNNKDG